jgi:hypothetical protein
MERVRSADGTSIAYERAGDGPAVILVGGGIVDRSENAPLVPELAAQFTVYNYDRRGRGDSTDTQPYDVRREIEDIHALIAAAGGSAHLYGASSGGALALEAAAAGLAIDKLAVYEVPYNMDANWPSRWREYAERLATALSEGRRGDAFALFMRVTGSSDADIEGLRNSPMWPGLKAVAHTLAYDAACLGNGRPPAARLASITQPMLVATGDDRPDDAATWVLALDEAADEIVARAPHAQRRTLEGQSHVAAPRALAAMLHAFFANDAAARSPDA